MSARRSLSGVKRKCCAKSELFRFCSAMAGVELRTQRIWVSTELRQPLTAASPRRSLLIHSLPSRSWPFTLFALASLLAFGPLSWAGTDAVRAQEKPRRVLIMLAFNPFPLGGTHKRTDSKEADNRTIAGAARVLFRLSRPRRLSRASARESHGALSDRQVSRPETRPDHGAGPELAAICYQVSG